LFTPLSPRPPSSHRYNDKTEYVGGVLVGMTGKAVPMMLVGDEKIRKQQATGKLLAASLRETRVGLIPPTGLADLCPRLREVDLRSNLISDWAEVALLGRQLPNLRVLNLSDNKLLPLTDALVAATPALAAPSPSGAPFPALRTLVVSETGMDWPNIALLSALCPVLEELHACANGVRALVPSPARRVGSGLGATVERGPASFVAADLFPALKTLNLSENPLGDWGQVYALAHLPSLTWLLVADCGIAEVWAAEDEKDAEAAAAAAAGGPSGGGDGDGAAPFVPAFARLEQLSLTGNPVASLSSVDALDAFPSLAALRLTHTDLAVAAAANTTDSTATGSAAAAAAASSSSSSSAAALGPSEARQVLVARCPRINMLNGSEVRVREREDAEKAYARRVGSAFADRERKGASVADIFGAKTAPEAAALNPYQPLSTSVSGGAAGAVAAPASASAASCVTSVPVGAGGGKTTLVMGTPTGFCKGSDAGVIKSLKGVDAGSVFVTAPHALWRVSSSRAADVVGGDDAGAAAAAAYLPLLDPWGLGASAPAAAARLQRLFPRYFLLAARHDLHAPAAAAASAASNLAASVVGLVLRSMAGASCMMEPQVKKLPLSMSVGAVKQLAARLFKCDPALQRLSFRDNPGAYPSLMDDDAKPLSYYGVTEGGEVLIEEVDPAEAARQLAEAEAAKAARVREQEVQGEAMRRAQEMSVAAGRRAVAATATAAAEERI
jgi:hypothetical protein